MLKLFTLQYFISFFIGYSAYKSFMIVEALLNNPVMHVFVDLLVESRKRKVHDRFSYTEVKPSEGNYTCVVCVYHLVYPIDSYNYVSIVLYIMQGPELF